MARDYAKKGGKKSGGGRKAAPGWLWLIAGLAVGLFIAFLVFLDQHESKPQRTHTAAKQQKPPKATNPPVTPAKPADPVKPETAPAPEKKPMNYDFYKRLQTFEVEVPEDKNGPRKPLSTPGSYVLQAGSFKNAKEADARKAELAMLGIVSSVQTVSADGKPVFHRVRVGPYRDLDRLNQVRQTLRDNRIEFVTLKERS